MKLSKSILTALALSVCGLTFAAPATASNSGSTMSDAYDNTVNYFAGSDTSKNSGKKMYDEVNDAKDRVKVTISYPNGDSDKIILHARDLPNMCQLINKHYMQFHMGDKGNKNHDAFISGGQLYNASGDYTTQFESDKDNNARNRTNSANSAY